MGAKLEIKIFVSCPGDVNDLKDIVETVCKGINESVDKFCPIYYRVLDWKSIVGSFGERPQEIINSTFKDYDLYFGIWWMRFGANTGADNPKTKEDYGSGTYEEFSLAFEDYNKDKRPEIVLFFKKPDAVETQPHIDQLGKVVKFRDEQMAFGWVNKFVSPLEFQNLVYKKLIAKMGEYCSSENIKEKKIFHEAHPSIDVNQYRVEIEPPLGYVNRFVIQYASFKQAEKSPFEQIKNETLSNTIQKYRRIIVLGDAGSGKSTELKNLAFNLNKEESPYITIFQQLNTYTSETGIENFLPVYWKEIPANLLVIIWDGLDEIQPKDFNTVIRQITAFSEKNPELRIVISCRNNFYESPDNNSPGTLNGFEPFYIRDFGIKDAKQYYETKYDKESEEFIRMISNEHLTDLLAKPYFLMLLSDIYSQGKMQNMTRASLYENFLLLRIRADEAHFKGTIDIREKKIEIFNLLEKVALSMEILARNYINEDELLQIITGDEFKLIKFCTAFRKSETKDKLWQFEHNNIQEYLAAKALVKMNFKNIINFIAFEPAHEKLIPSWVNTLVFMFSIMESNDPLLNKITNWIIEHDKEIIVKFEKEKISEDLRNTIFKAIFRYFKKSDLIIRSNKFRTKELARFGQSVGSINFITKQILDTKSTIIVKLNCISLLGYFNYDTDSLKNKVCRLLINQIKVNIADTNFVYSTLYSMYSAQMNSGSVIEQLMTLLNKTSSPKIRSAMYLLLSNSDSIENYVDYLLAGFAALDSVNKMDRSGISFYDDQIHLFRCLKTISSPVGVIKIIDFFSENYNIKFSHSVDEIEKSIIENAIVAYGKSNAVYDSVLHWFTKEVAQLVNEDVKMIMPFFDQTSTRQKAFHDIWNKTEMEARNKAMVLANLLTSDLVPFIAERYNSHDITNTNLKELHFSLQWIRSPILELFENTIQETTQFKFEKPEIVDFESQRRKKLQADFDILFTPQVLLEETLRVFTGEGKEVLKGEDLHGIRLKGNRYSGLEEYYSGSALDLLRRFTSGARSINSTQIKKWFEKIEEVEFDTIFSIYQTLVHSKEIVVSQIQITQLQNWCNKLIRVIDFTKSITTNGDSVTFDNKAIITWYFIRRFDFKIPESVMLDLLSYYTFEAGQFSGTEYLLKRLPINDVKSRVITNMKNGIEDDTIFKNQSIIAMDNKIVELYPIILDEIANSEKKIHYRSELLELYIEKTKDTEGVKQIFEATDIQMKWMIIEKLIAIGETSFVTSKLLKILKSGEPKDIHLKAAGFLMKLQNLEGLKYYVEYMKDAKGLSTDGLFSHGISALKTAKAIPYLMQLLELTYRNNIEINSFENLHNVTLSGFYNIALSSESNFLQVTKELRAFINTNKAKYDHVKYLMHTVDRLDEQFYMNKAQSFTIKQVKEKLKLI